MEIKVGISLRIKQSLSQVQMESLNILCMSAAELQEFLQNEEIENPLMEYSLGEHGKEQSITYRETERFYNGGGREDSGERELYEAAGDPESVEELVTMQLPWERLDTCARKIVDFCIHSLEQSGYLPLSAREIAKALETDTERVERVLTQLKALEPCGIFASGLEECLLMQAAGLEREQELVKIIQNHLQDVAEGKISNISRATGLSSMEVRKLIHIIKGLNPRPLNGYGDERAQYIIPDILLSCKEGQWNIELNDRWAGQPAINGFYVHMMEAAQDEELKGYFEEKLRRARFIINAVEQRRRTLLGITRGILERQERYLLGKGSLKSMTLEQIADELAVHKSTVSRAIRDKYLLAPAGCFLLRNLFTTGIAAEDGNAGGVSRSAVKKKLKALVAAEDKRRPCSDEQLAESLRKAGMAVSRRTVAKYRTELGIGGTFKRREV
ncbi:MAG: RNA polymerase factor sigma-54 [Lachnospiraceae bacterium]|nr:RNA polymerase factor sigma-54 [Lachnospiraceae bacterium]